MNSPPQLDNAIIRSALENNATNNVKKKPSGSMNKKGKLNQENIDIALNSQKYAVNNEKANSLLCPVLQSKVSISAQKKMSFKIPLKEKSQNSLNKTKTVLQPSSTKASYTNIHTIETPKGINLFEYNSQGGGNHHDDSSKSSTYSRKIRNSATTASSSGGLVGTNRYINQSFSHIKHKEFAPLQQSLKKIHTNSLPNTPIKNGSGLNKKPSMIWKDASSSLSSTMLIITNDDKKRFYSPPNEDIIIHDTIIPNEISKKPAPFEPYPSINVEENIFDVKDEMNSNNWQEFEKNPLLGDSNKNLKNELMTHRTLIQDVNHPSTDSLLNKDGLSTANQTLAQIVGELNTTRWNNLPNDYDSNTQSTLFKSEQSESNLNKLILPITTQGVTGVGGGGGLVSSSKAVITEGIIGEQDKSSERLGKNSGYSQRKQESNCFILCLNNSYEDMVQPPSSTSKHSNASASSAKGKEIQNSSSKKNKGIRDFIQGMKDTPTHIASSLNVSSPTTTITNTMMNGNTATMTTNIANAITSVNTSTNGSNTMTNTTTTTTTTTIPTATVSTSITTTPQTATKMVNTGITIVNNTGTILSPTATTISHNPITTNSPNTTNSNTHSKKNYTQDFFDFNKSYKDQNDILLYDNTIFKNKVEDDDSKSNRRNRDMRKSKTNLKKNDQDNHHPHLGNHIAPSLNSNQPSAKEYFSSDHKEDHTSPTQQSQNLKVADILEVGEKRRNKPKDENADMNKMVSTSLSNFNTSTGINASHNFDKKPTFKLNEVINHDSLNSGGMLLNSSDKILSIMHKRIKSLGISPSNNNNSFDTTTFRPSQHPPENFSFTTILPDLTVSCLDVSDLVINPNPKVGSTIKEKFIKELLSRNESSTTNKDRVTYGINTKNTGFGLSSLTNNRGSNPITGNSPNLRSIKNTSLTNKSMDSFNWDTTSNLSLDFKSTKTHSNSQGLGIKLGLGELGGVMPNTPTTNTTPKTTTTTNTINITRMESKQAEKRLSLMKKTNTISATASSNNANGTCMNAFLLLSPNSPPNQIKDTSTLTFEAVSPRENSSLNMQTDNGANIPNGEILPIFTGNESEQQSFLENSLVNFESKCQIQSVEDKMIEKIKGNTQGGGTGVAVEISERGTEGESSSMNQYTKTNKNDLALNMKEFNCIFRKDFEEFYRKMTQATGLEQLKNSNNSKVTACNGNKYDKEIILAYVMSKLQIDAQEK